MLSNLQIKKAKQPKTPNSQDTLYWNFWKHFKDQKKKKSWKQWREIWYFSYKEKNNPEFPPQTTEPKEVTQLKTWTLYMKQTHE